MKVESFFQKFDLFADAPNAVEKMRELLLQLAVRGRLVHQLAGDEPAIELLDKIRKSKEQLIGERVIRRQVTESVADREVPFSIPNSWIWTRLGEIGSWGSGSTPARGNHDLYGGGITWLKSGELNDNQALAGSEETITDLAVKTGSFRRNQPGDVLLAMYGATIGKAAILAEPALTNQAVCGCTAFDGVFNRYLFYFLLSQRARFHSASEGGAQPNISKVKIVGFPFPLPPYAEQSRIVAKLDELMGLCNRLEAEQQDRITRHIALSRASLAGFADAPNPSNLSLLFHQSYDISPGELRKAVLTLAVKGKLVPQDPSDEPAQVLLQRVDEEREQLVRTKQIRRQDFLGPIADGLTPFDIPATWQWRYLADLCFLITDGAHHTPKYLQSGVPFLSVKDVSGGEIDFSSTRYISEDAHRELCRRARPEKGDILLTKVGTTGIAVTVDEDREFSIFVSLALLKFSKANLDGRFLKYLFNSPFVKQQSASGTQGIGNKNLVLRLINRFTVAVPPLTEQRRIVARVEQLMALLDELETQLAASRAAATDVLSAFVVALTAEA